MMSDMSIRVGSLLALTALLMVAAASPAAGNTVRSSTACGGMLYGPPAAQQKSNVTQIIAIHVDCKRARAVVLNLLKGQWHIPELSMKRKINGFSCRPATSKKTILVERCTRSPALILIYSTGDF